MAPIMDFLHWVTDYLMSWVKLGKNQQYGWRSLDRKTGQIKREQEPLLKKLKLLLLFNPLTEWLDTTHAMRLYIHNENVSAGQKEGTAASKRQIKSFVETYHINMDDFEPSDIHAYDTFESFFTRRHKPSARPIHAPDDASNAVVVADSRVVCFDSMAETKKLWIKGHNFTVDQLVMDTDLAKPFVDGAVASFRLSPQDYHRYHSPVSGKVKLHRGLPGTYYQVDAVALHSKVDILTKNRRDLVVIETEEFGDVLFVAIGATDVGSVQIHDKWRRPGAEIRKGDELGLFQFGGSSIIVIFPKGSIEFDRDLIEPSRQQIQVAVEVGMSLGRVVEKKG